MTIHQSQFEKCLLIGTFLLIGIIFFGFSVYANINLIHPLETYIDEQVTFKGVYRILTADSASQFWWEISNGGDLRYGRILWYTLAAVGYIPFSIWSTEGIILTGRLISASFLISAYALLTITFINNWRFRIPCFLILLSLPFSSYFSTIPKPEPFALLSLGIFLLLSKKNFLALNRPYWIWLGIAFGCKISFLPALAILFISAAWINNLSPINMRDQYELLLKTIIYLYIGFNIAMPIFITPSLIVLIMLFSIHFMLQTFINKNLSITLSLFAVTGIITVPAIRDLLPFNLGIRSAIEEYIYATFYKINKGFNSSEIYSSLDWISYFIKSWTFSPSLIAQIILIIMGLLFAAILFIVPASSGPRAVKAQLLMPLALGLILFANPIFAVTNRLWGMYLLPGFVFLVIACFSYADFVNHANKKMCSNPMMRLSRLLSTFACSTLIICSLLYWIPHTLSDYIFLGNRSSNAIFHPWNHGI
jgi:hypothetical protein